MNAMKDLNRAQMMNQQNKAAWLQRRVEDGSITSHAQLVETAVKIHASSRVCFMVQDYFGTKLPTRD